MHNLHLFYSTGQSRKDFLIMCSPLLAVLQLSSASIRILLAKDVEESRVHLVRQVAGLQAAALLGKSEPGALLSNVKSGQSPAILILG